MRDLDRPVGEAAVQECGDPMMGGMTPPMGASTQPPPAHPSMSVNLNAQGMDSIESLLKLMTKVNPDMLNQPTPLTPPLTPPPMTAIPSISSIGDLGNLDRGPLKMLPDLDSDNDMMPGGEMDADYDDNGKLDRHEKDHASEKGLLKSLDLDKDGDHDMDDHGMKKKMVDKDPIDKDGEEDGEADNDKEKEGEEPKTIWDGGLTISGPGSDIAAKRLDINGDLDDNEENEEAFGNSVAGHDGPDYKGMSASTPSGNDMHKQKGTYPKVAGGDNPMQRVKEGGDLRAQIRAELLQRLSEAKGAK